MTKAFLIVFIGLLIIGGCTGAKNVGDVNVIKVGGKPTMSQPAQTEQDSFAKSYKTWGSYAVLSNVLKNILVRLFLLTILVIVLTFLLPKYLAFLSIIPKMWLSFIASLLLFLIRIVLSIFTDFHIGEAIIDGLITTVIANYSYGAFVKKKLFKKD